MKNVIIATGVAAFLLLANIEMGTAGVWADICLLGIILFWCGLYAFCKWKTKNAGKMKSRHDKKAFAEAADDYDRKLFIMNTKAMQ